MFAAQSTEWSEPMLSDDRRFLTRERQLDLLSEAAADRLARQIPPTPGPSPRERLGSALINLAVRIAPSLGNPPHEGISVPARCPGRSPSASL
jgi:hypothetical protein